MVYTEPPDLIQRFPWTSIGIALKLGRKHRAVLNRIRLLRRSLGPSFGLCFQLSQYIDPKTLNLRPAWRMNRAGLIILLSRMNGKEVRRMQSELYC